VNGTTTFTVTPDTGYHTESATGCSGTLNGDTYTTGPVTADCTLSASFAVNTYTIGTAATNGSVTCTPSTVNYGSGSNCTITPNSGYSVSEVFVDGSSAGPVSSYTFSTVTANHTISAVFGLNVYTVTAAATGSGGNVTPASQAVANGSTATVAVTPDTGYHINSVAGCSGSLSGNAYTTGPITADCTVTATFAADAPNTYAVTPSAGAGGTISPGTAQTVTANGSASFTITPASGYQIASVTGCGGILSDGKIDVGDVIMILRRSVGLVSW
jgi:hypothetical protein